MTECLVNLPLLVDVWAADPVSRAGILSQLAADRGLRLADAGCPAAVSVVLVDHVDDVAVTLLQSLRGNGTRVVLVSPSLDDHSLLRAVEAGVSAVVLRAHATTGELEEAVHEVAAGRGSLPPELLGRLMGEVGRLQRQVLAPRGLTPGGLTAREVAVLRLVADGYDTGEIAIKLSYSERTIKNVLHDLRTRLGLRNRTHLVAYALREHLI